jgi:hypothetical protein
MAKLTSAPPLHLFDDQRGQFGPLTHRRPAFDLRAGAITQRCRIERALDQPAAGLHLDPLLARCQPGSSAACNPAVEELSAVLLVSGRWIGTGEMVASIRSLARGEAIVQGEDLVAAHLEGRAAQRLIDSGFAELPDGVKPQPTDEALLSRPWHLLDALPRLLQEDLEGPCGGVDPEARVHRSAVLEDSNGPIGIAAGAVIGPLSVLEGPCWIGPGSRVHAHAHVRPHTVISNNCKAGGEISASILYPNSNKSHYGYLGDSIVGSWCNLGAGTTVSNLKNTYGEVRVQLEAQGPAEGTGRTFHGPVLGDFVRTAIGSRLMTGSCVATGCCIAVSGFAPKYVPPLTFLTDAGACRYEFDAFLAHTGAAMRRRDQALSEAEIAVLRRL